MLEFLDGCGYWIELHGTVNGRSADVGIKLENDSMAQAYLFTRRSSTVDLCVPVNGFVLSSVTDSTMCVVFTNHNSVGMSVTVDAGNSQLLDVLNAQVSLCSRICSILSDQFVEENVRFLQKLQPVSVPTPTARRLYPMLLPVSLDGKAKDTWSRRTAAHNCPYFTQTRPVTMLFYTWNVAQHRPDESDESMVSRIFAINSDVIFISLQEMDFTASAVIFGGSKLCKLWGDVFMEHGSIFGYEKVSEDSLGGVYCLVVKRRGMEMSVKETERVTRRLGTSGLTANKSSIIMRLDINGMSIALAGAHLTHSEEQAHARDLQIREIAEVIDGMKVDYAVIAGDLNYRVELPYETAVEHAQHRDIDILLTKDQMRGTETEAYKQGFREQPINFLPTYRFDPGCDVYDTSKKRRVPSWTDRILVKTATPRIAVGFDDFQFETDILRHANPSGAFRGPSFFSISDPEFNYPSPPECTLYNSFQDVRLSDHRPVLGVFSFPTVYVDEERRNSFRKMQGSRYDEIRTLSIARCSVEPQSFCLEDVTDVVMCNTSCVVCEWHVSVHPDGITVTPERGTLGLGEKVRLSLKCEEPLPPEKHVVAIEIDGGVPVVFQFDATHEES